MANETSVSLQINDVSVDWTERTQRVLKPCVKCSKLTKGRMRNGGGISKPACMTCAIDQTVGQALKFYTVVRNA